MGEGLRAGAWLGAIGGRATALRSLRRILRSVRPNVHTGFAKPSPFLSLPTLRPVANAPVGRSSLARSAPCAGSARPLDKLPTKGRAGPNRRGRREGSSRGRVAYAPPERSERSERARADQRPPQGRSRDWTGAEGALLDLRLRRTPLSPMLPISRKILRNRTLLAEQVR